MSRVGNVPIPIPSGVNVEVKDSKAIVKGPKGELSVDIYENIDIKVEDSQVTVTRKNDEKKTKSFHGLIKSLIENAIKGTTEGFTKTLVIKGVGYRASVSGKSLTLSLGLSHDIKFQIPEGVDVSTEEDKINVTGIDKQLVGQVAANIRSFKKPEPYKGKGIRYEDERVKRKAGKAAAAAAE